MKKFLVVCSLPLVVFFVSRAMFGMFSAPAVEAPSPVVAPVQQESQRFGSIEAYFKAKNPNPISHRQGLPRYERDVSNRLRKAILERDGHACVVCGSTRQPEVDHGRGLQNNGSNEPENLAVLCHECHVAKTAMDRSVRRQRDKLAKQKKTQR